MSTVTEEQLTLDVGGEIGQYIVSEFSVSGGMRTLSHELEREERVHVRIIDEGGEILVSSQGWISQVAFETKPATEKQSKHTVRKHTIKLD